ncbi:MAG: bacterio-opsin activator domain-containing protein [Halodesulfurarchaeum sp.]
MSQTISQKSKSDRIRVLLVDDDTDFAETAAKLLKRGDDSLEVIVRTDPDEAIATLESTTVDAVISDYRMPNRDGFDVLEAARSLDPSLPFFLITGAGNETVASEAITAGVTDYFRKGAISDQFDALANRIHNAVRSRAAERSLRRNERFLQAVFDGIKDGLAVVDGNLDIVRANDWLEDRAGKPLTGRKCYKVIRGVDSPRAGEVCPVKEALETGERQRMETELTHLGPPFWAEISTDPLSSLSVGERVLIQVRDISERKRRERKLEKRERVFRALHEQTNRCLDATSRAEVYQHIATGVGDTLAHDRVAVLEYDTEDGSLSLEHRTEGFRAGLGSIDRIRPGTDPLWDPFQNGQTAVIQATELETALERDPEPGTDFLAVPMSDYGLILIHRQVAVEHAEIDLELLDLCAANAEAILERIESAGRLGSVTDRVAAQAGRIENLRGFLRSIQRIHSELAAGATRSAVEKTVVRELVESDLVGFAWIGRPETGDVRLSPTTWAGSDSTYLDQIDLTGDVELTPAQEAARNREPVVYQNIAEHLQHADWAKTALTAGMQSASAFPIEYDGVLYGVLAVFGNQSGQFDRTTKSILADVAALLGARIGVQNVRIGTTEPPAIELEVSISDPKHVLYALSREAGVRVRFETVLESREETVRIVVSVPREAPDTIIEAATSLTHVRDTSWFGDPADRRLLLELDGPCIGTGATHHGGVLRRAVADGDTATVTIGVPADISPRPLLEWLQSTYREVELLAKREPEPAQSDLPDPTALLTDRQAEVLKAAYVGGYFENPRQITGEELAETFDISGSAVYKHLRSAEKRLLERLLDISVENEGLDT